VPPASGRGSRNPRTGSSRTKAEDGTALMRIAERRSSTASCGWPRVLSLFTPSCRRSANRTRFPMPRRSRVPSS
jgi:hypothetical protein